MSEGPEDTGRLHTAMVEATAHIGAITMDPARLRRARRRYRLAEGGAVAGVLSIALAATAIAMNTGPAKTSPGGTAVPTPPSQIRTTAAPQPRTITPIAVSVYDSDSGTEGKETVDQLLAGTGAWQTNQYCQSHATHDGILKGTGLIFDLGASTHPLTVSVDVALPGADMEVWAGDSSVTWPVPILQNQPPAGFMKAASVPASQSAGTNVFHLTGFMTRYVLVWFSGTLPAVPNGNTMIKCAHEDGYRYGDAIKAVKFTQS